MITRGASGRPADRVDRRSWPHNQPLDMPMGDLLASLSSNPYFGAGFGLVGVGAGLAILRKSFILTTVVAKKAFTITLEVPCRDRSYSWLLQWINKNAQRKQHVSVCTSESSAGTTFDFIPSVGVHFFNFHGHWIRVERTREQQSLDLHMGIPFETVTLSTIGTNAKIFQQILTEASILAAARIEGKTVTYTAMGHEWREFGEPKKRRPISSVILDGDKAQRILSDVQEFLSSEKWYTERGVPFRRGYLLHGPPGGGKTSFITALAGELRLGICILNLSDRGLSDDRLHHLLSSAPPQTLLLLEDVDAAFVSREDSSQTRAAYDGLSRVTFSGLLNALDGVASAEGRILFMTSNYAERLDPALIRPGRVDVKEFIGNATDDQLQRAFERFYPNCDGELARKFVQKIPKPVSMAAVQGFFLKYKDNPQLAVVNVNKDSVESIKPMRVS